MVGRDFADGDVGDVGEGFAVREGTRDGEVLVGGGVEAST